MSLLSEREKMIMAGKAPAASRDELLQAAILESNERYEQHAKEIIAALNRLEAAVRASNEQKDMNIQEALKKASTAILEDVRTESAEYIKAMDAATARLNAAHKKKARNDAWESLKGLCMAIVAFAIGGYIANWAFGWWYDIPLKVDAVNNALWQLLNK